VKVEGFYLCSATLSGKNGLKLLMPIKNVPSIEHHHLFFFSLEALQDQPQGDLEYIGESLSLSLRSKT